MKRHSIESLNDLLRSLKGDSRYLIHRDFDESCRPVYVLFKYTNSEFEAFCDRVDVLFVSRNKRDIFVAAFAILSNNDNSSDFWNPFSINYLPF